MPNQRWHQDLLVYICILYMYSVYAGHGDHEGYADADQLGYRGVTSCNGAIFTDYQFLWLIIILPSPPGHDVLPLGLNCTIHIPYKDCIQSTVSPYSPVASNKY
jgi:hypothetical protein